MGTTLDSQNKIQYYIFTLKFGDPTTPSYFRFTDWSMGVNVAGLNYDPVMELDLRWPVRDGGLKPETVGLQVPTVTKGLTDLSVFARLAGKESVEPVFITIEAVYVDKSSDLVIETYVEFSGRLFKCVDNYQGKPGVALLEFNDKIKGELDVPMGFPVVHHCIWTLGDEKGSPCALDISTFRETGTLITRDSGGFLVSVTGLTIPATPGGGQGASGYWHRGYFELGGLRLGIRDWDPTRPTIFKLSEPAPPSWESATITATPGCDKLIQTCRERWDREESFMGLGIAMVAYNPTIETQ